MINEVVHIGYIFAVIEILYHALLLCFHIFT